MIRFSRGMMLGAAMAVALGTGAAFAQQAEDAKPQALKFAPPAAALVIAIERVLDESASGKAIRTQIDAARDALRQEAVATDAALKAREEELVALKPTLSADEFEAKARAFEGQVREARKAAQGKGAELQQSIQSAQSDLRRALTPVLISIMKDKGATILLDETQVILSARELDVTDEAIARLDALNAGVKLVYPPVK